MTTKPTTPPIHSLSEETCQSCNTIQSTLSEQEINGYMKRLNQWKKVSIDGTSQLTKTFSFKNFVEALVFTNTVGELAEAEDHHPTLVTQWGSVQVTWWTHSIGGLHTNDFILAARTDRLHS